jgi:hypothetical protein
MPSVEFTQDEYTVLSDTARKLLKVRANLRANEWKKPQHKAVKAFANKFKEEVETGPQTRILDRNDLRLIQEVCTAAGNALSTAIIPNYERRLKELPDRADFYRPYLEKAQEALTIYRDLQTKVEAIL